MTRLTIKNNALVKYNDASEKKPIHILNFAVRQRNDTNAIELIHNWIRTDEMLIKPVKES